MESLLLNFYDHIDIFMLVTARLLGFFVAVPIFGGQNVPIMTRISFSLLISAIIVTAHDFNLGTIGDTGIAYLAIITKEALVGVIIGFTVYFIFSILYYVGQLIDYQIGFSMISVMDPVSQIQIPITGNLYYLTICVLVVIAGGDHYFFRTIFHSYEVLPIGQSILFNEYFFNTVLDMIQKFFLVGYKIALPIVGTILVLDVVLGILTKTAPQMHIFSVGIIIKMLVGLAVLVFITPTLLSVADTIYGLTQEYLNLLIRDMMP